MKTILCIYSLIQCLDYSKTACESYKDNNNEPYILSSVQRYDDQEGTKYQITCDSPGDIKLMGADIRASK